MAKVYDPVLGRVVDRSPGSGTGTKPIKAPDTPKETGSPTGKTPTAPAPIYNKKSSSGSSSGSSKKSFVPDKYQQLADKVTPNKEELPMSTMETPTEGARPKEQSYVPSQYQQFADKVSSPYKGSSSSSKSKVVPSTPQTQKTTEELPMSTMETPTVGAGSKYTGKKDALFWEQYGSQMDEYSQMQSKVEEINRARNVQLFQWENGKIIINPNLPSEKSRQEATKLAGQYGLDLNKQYTPSVPLLQKVNDKYIVNPYLPSEYKEEGNKALEEYNIEYNKALFEALNPKEMYKRTIEEAYLKKYGITGTFELIPLDIVKDLEGGLGTTPTEKWITYPNIKGIIAPVDTFTPKTSSEYLSQKTVLLNVDNTDLVVNKEDIASKFELAGKKFLNPNYVEPGYKLADLPTSYMTYNKEGKQTGLYSIKDDKILSFTTYDGNIASDFSFDGDKLVGGIRGQDKQTFVKDKLGNYILENSLTTWKYTNLKDLDDYEGKGPMNYFTGKRGLTDKQIADVKFWTDIERGAYARADELIDPAVKLFIGNAKRDDPLSYPAIYTFEIAGALGKLGITAIPTIFGGISRAGAQAKMSYIDLTEMKLSESATKGIKAGQEAFEPTILLTSIALPFVKLLQPLKPVIASNKTGVLTSISNKAVNVISKIPGISNPYVSSAYNVISKIPGISNPYVSSAYIGSGMALTQQVIEQKPLFTTESVSLAGKYTGTIIGYRLIGLGAEKIAQNIIITSPPTFRESVLKTQANKYGTFSEGEIVITKKLNLPFMKERILSEQILGKTYTYATKGISTTTFIGKNEFQGIFEKTLYETKGDFIFGYSKSYYQGKIFDERMITSKIYKFPYYDNPNLEVSLIKSKTYKITQTQKVKGFKALDTPVKLTAKDVEFSITRQGNYGSETIYRSKIINPGRKIPFTYALERDIKILLKEQGIKFEMPMPKKQPTITWEKSNLKIDTIFGLDDVYNSKSFYTYEKIGSKYMISNEQTYSTSLYYTKDFKPINLNPAEQILTTKDVSLISIERKGMLIFNSKLPLNLNIDGIEFVRNFKSEFTKVTNVKDTTSATLKSSSTIQRTIPLQKESIMFEPDVKPFLLDVQLQKQNLFLFSLNNIQTNIKLNDFSLSLPEQKTNVLTLEKQITPQMIKIEPKFIIGEKNIIINDYKPMVLPIEGTIQKPIQKPIDKPIDKPIEDVIIKPIDKPIDKPITKPIIKPIQKPNGNTTPPPPKIIIPPPPFNSGGWELKGKKKKKVELKVKLKKGSRFILPDMFSVVKSQYMFGTATRLPTKKAYKYERQSVGGRIPTAELVKYKVKRGLKL